MSAVVLLGMLLGEMYDGGIHARLLRQEITAYKMAWRECEAAVREADANRVEHGHCVAVRKPREWKK